MLQFANRRHCVASYLYLIGGTELADPRAYCVLHGVRAVLSTAYSNLFHAITQSGGTVKRAGRGEKDRSV